MQRAYSAPGKLFLCGEYAVLWGGSARVAAVGPRTAAFVRRRADRDIHLALEEGRFSGQQTPLGVNWGGEAPVPFRFVARAVDFVLRAHGREALGFELALGPSPTSEEGHKLGLGGSARAAVLASECARFVLEARFDALKVALLAHASAQGGKGSGADVAAVFAGGIVRYRRYDVAPLAAAAQTGQLFAALAEAPPVDLWRLPSPKCSLAYAFAGTSASTLPLIDEVERSLSLAGKERFVLDSDELGSALEAALLEGDFDMVKRAVRELQSLLSKLGPVTTEPLRRLIALADSFGCVAKVSGAGGGDGCVVFAPDEPTRAAFLEGLNARGVWAMPLSIEAGIRGEPAPEPALVRWL